MQVKRTSASFAEASYHQGALTTSTLGQTGLCSTVASPLLHQDSPGFVSLADICHEIRRSKSWIYEQGIVPLIDDDGKPVESTKKPPFPWLPLPLPCINLGKKLWAKADVDRWMLNIRARAVGSTDATNEYARSTSEVVV